MEIITCAIPIISLAFSLIAIALSFQANRIAKKDIEEQDQRAVVREYNAAKELRCRK